MAGKFELYKDNGGEFRFRLKAGNGEIVGTSEGYKAKASAENGIESVKKNASDDGRYEFKEGKNGKWYFNLKASNGQVILSSQGYASESGAKEGTGAVARATDGAKTDDQT
ncbi:YegP family protein [uncultured Sneathiella sp.]|uniref:YegP family protein n=1 Tax=uncultured Sneathiella sp. TaxID=879315 RepID=UPI0030EBD7C8|tara:strand:- start:2419 stop:2751 length:333 start_codon:yes stop_codon:yes gene_type:complete